MKKKVLFLIFVLLLGVTMGGLGYYFADSYEPSEFLTACWKKDTGKLTRNLSVK